MLQITLPDGTLREFDQPLSVSELASSIGLGLARAAVAGRVNGTLVDCAFVIRHNARVGIVTAREPEGLEILRRSCALLLAMAIKQLHARASILSGSVVGDGFYCEFSHSRTLHPDDLRINIGAVLQDVTLFSGSIRDNITLQFASRLFQRDGVIMYRVGVATNRGRIPTPNADEGARGNTPHWHLVEFGTERAQAQPFMRPALANNINQVINSFTFEFDKELDKALS